MNRIELDLKWALEKRFTLKQWASWLQRTMATALYGSANPSKEVGSWWFDAHANSVIARCAPSLPLLVYCHAFLILLETAVVVGCRRGGS